MLPIITRWQKFCLTTTSVFLENNIIETHKILYACKLRVKYSIRDFRKHRSASVALDVPLNILKTQTIGKPHEEWRKPTALHFSAWIGTTVSRVLHSGFNASAGNPNERVLDRKETWLSLFKTALLVPSCDNFKYYNSLFPDATVFDLLWIYHSSVGWLENNHVPRGVDGDDVMYSKKKKGYRHGRS